MRVILEAESKENKIVLTNQNGDTYIVDSNDLILFLSKSNSNEYSDWYSSTVTIKEKFPYVISV